MGTVESTTVNLKDGRSAVVRMGVPGDAQALLEFLDAVLRESDHLLLEPGEMQLAVEQEAGWVRMHQEDPGSVLLVAEAMGQIVAVSALARSGRRRLAHHAELAISIRAAWRGVGLGRALMETLLGWARANPVLEKVCLSVFGDNAQARELYRRLGFVEEGCRVRQMRTSAGRYSDEVLMACPVKPG
jgi:RimJ/RimL family protein N-acetyltransferase